jgi:hypothetical protein
MGATLLEIMLVLTISSSILVLGLKMYNQFQVSGYVEQVKYNVDVLLEAMTQYYHAQCSTGTLSSAPLNQPYTITMAQLAPYLPAKWESKIPLVQGYAFQFNPTLAKAPANPVYVNDCNLAMKNTPTPCIAEAPTALTSTEAQTVIWNVQVSVQFIPTFTQPKVNAWQLLTSADCVSAISGTLVAQCPARSATIAASQNQVAIDQAALAAPSCTAACQVTTQNQLNTDQTALTNALAGNYLVWQRLPAATGSKVISDLWLMEPILKEFTLEYTHDQMRELGNMYATPTTPSNPQNYLCGG